MKFQWAKTAMDPDVWQVVLVREGYIEFCGIEPKIPIEHVQEWGPVCWPPRDVPRTPIVLVVNENDLEVVNAADYGDKKKEGEVYIAPDFKIVSGRAGDCAVVALANVLDLDYKSARLMAFQHGWSSLSGMTDGFIELIVEKKGFKTFFRKDLTKGYVFEWEFKKADGTFLVYCKDHVMPALGNSKHPFNLQKTSHREITSVIEIRKISKESPCNL